MIALIPAPYCLMLIYKMLVGIQVIKNAGITVFLENTRFGIEQIK